MPDDETIQKLLRLKKYEQPGPEYFENFLVEFHRRQRAELLRRPLWRIALDRAEAFFGAPSFAPIGHLQYATAVFVVMAGLALLTFRGGDRPSDNLAAKDPVPPSQLFAQRSLPPAAEPVDDFAQFDVRVQSAARQSQAVATPRYVIDARPASYEPTFDF